MPRSAGIYSLPAGTTAVAGEVIDPDDFNAFTADLVSDLNAARPVSAGGTGSATASDARTALGLAYERGSNANGEYVKYPDGTLICTRTVTPNLAASSVTTYDYPETFLSNPDAVSWGITRSAATIAGNDAAALRQALLIGTATQWGFINVPTSGANTVFSSISLFAVGRWA